MNGISLRAPLGLPLILAIGLLLRLAWTAVVPVEPVSDSAAYDTFARMIVEHGVYGWTPEQPSAYWAVGTSAIAAATYAVLGDTYAGVVALNLLAGLGAIVFVHHLGRLYFGPVAGLVAAAVMALWPNLIFFTTILSSELFFIFLTAGGLYFWEGARAGYSRAMLICGLFWAAACYVRPVIVLLPLALTIASVSGGLAALGRSLGKTLVVLAVIITLVAPWTYRNYLVFEQPVFVSTNFGPNFWMGNNPESDGGYMPLPERIEGLSEPERSALLLDEALAHIEEHPTRFLANTAWKAWVLHSWETIGVAWNEAALSRMVGSIPILFLKAVSTGYWYLVLVTALVGVGMTIRRHALRAVFHPAFGGWAYFTAVHAVIVVGDRYHMPNVPFIAIYAGVGLMVITRYLIQATGNEPRLRHVLEWLSTPEAKL